MDLASERARRKNRSSTNLNHLTLAPLTVKLPIEDDLEREFSAPANLTPGTISYIQGKSAPTTPRLISHSPATARSRSRHRRTPSAPGAQVSKSKSTTHLAASNTRRTGTKSGTTTPNGRRRHHHHHEDGLNARDRNDSDWLLRTGALMSTEARESKGQAWLVSRQSSTSLTGMHDAEDDAFEHELQHGREPASRRTSRRGSSAIVLEDDEFHSPFQSRFASRNQSRSHSIAAGTSSHLLSPSERPDAGSYFDAHASMGPDFVNLDEKLEELESAQEDDDEAAVRRLVRRGQANKGSWIGNLMGWSLFSLDEHEEDSEDESVDEDAVSQGGRSASWAAREIDSITGGSNDHAPPPQKDEGGWKDAAWLLSVATKVIF